MTELGYVGTAVVFTGVGFLICSAFFTRAYWAAIRDRGDLMLALFNAGSSLKAAGRAEEAALAFGVAKRVQETSAC
ncbi:hypothetical protein AB7M45_007871 [Bradyrhizobium elkanii]|uniref:hypothetical protein n=1 Tax=Bradyrhizobium elkanii TaxID=29448 RepID=UPI00092378B5|nr:hypothetical protein [Bradyrhizobium elkanii]MCW2195100.1 hypothetical protein [Bradyrhizobium elkanii]NWL67208.1 hypothetical protein [Bradyrhizobium elkanii]OIM94121.1 hypothetical protein BLN97_12680 [Bradyrhizobium elkanii]